MEGAAVERESQGSARSARRGRREASSRLTLDAAGGAYFGSRGETQITEVAAQKGTLQNGGFKKKIQPWVVYFSCWEEKSFVLISFSCGGKSEEAFRFFSIGILASRVRHEATLLCALVRSLLSHSGKIWIGCLILNRGRKKKQNLHILWHCY